MVTDMVVSRFAAQHLDTIWIAVAQQAYELIEAVDCGVCSIINNLFKVL